MSPVLDKSALYRRWLHLPSIAVIALAGASVAIAHMGIDAWRARFVPKHEPTNEPLTTALVGRSAIQHVHPDHIEWGLTVSASATGEDAAAMALAARAHQAIDKLLAAGVARSEIVVEETVITPPDTSDVYGGLTGNVRSPAVTALYEASLQIGVHSLRVASSLGAYQTLVLDPTPMIDVALPSCWREDMSALEHDARQAAWADLNQQTALLRAGHVAVGRVISAQVSDVELNTHGGSWSCEDDQTAYSTVSVSYELR